MRVQQVRPFPDDVTSTGGPAGRFVGRFGETGAIGVNWALTGSWLTRTRHRQGSRVASTPLRVHAVASTPEETTGRFRSCIAGRYRSLVDLPVTSASQRLHIEFFETCSAFTRVTDCTLAKPPDSSRFAPKCFNPLRYLHELLRSLPAGTNALPGRSTPAGVLCLGTGVGSCRLRHSPKRQDSGSHLQS